MEVIIKETYEEISKLAAEMIAEQVNKKPDSVLGFATGSTPVGTYQELIRLNKEGKVDFSKVKTFNLDEYIGLDPEHNQSYHYFMNENLFAHINIKPENWHVPPGKADDFKKACEEYEQMIVYSGGLDIQLLGIGGNGHIAFNEPVSSLGSRTRVKTLTKKTIEDNARFFENIEDVPRFAVTMGIGTIMEARKVILLGNKANKADAIAATVEGPITAMVPATVVQLHRDATIIVEKEAASKLSREYPSEPAVLKL